MPTSAAPSATPSFLSIRGFVGFRYCHVSTHTDGKCCTPPHPHETERSQRHVSPPDSNGEVIRVQYRCGPVHQSVRYHMHGPSERANGRARAERGDGFGIARACVWRLSCARPGHALPSLALPLHFVMDACGWVRNAWKPIGSGRRTRTETLPARTKQRMRQDRQKLELQLHLRGGCDDFDHEVMREHAAQLKEAHEKAIRTGAVTTGVAKLMHKKTSCRNSLAIILRIRDQRVVLHRIPVYDSHCVFFPMLPEHTSALQPVANLECVAAQLEAMNTPSEFVEYIERSRYVSNRRRGRAAFIDDECDDDDDERAGEKTTDPERHRVQIRPLRVFANPDGVLSSLEDLLTRF